MPDHFRSTPQDVLAVQWTGASGAWDSLREWIGEERLSRTLYGDGLLYLKAGPHGVTDWVPVQIGSWVVGWRDNPDLDFWPMDAGQFAAKYEMVHDGHRRLVRDSPQA